MANDNNPRGFVAARRLNGKAPSGVKRYKTGANNAAAIYAGDPVELKTNGYVSIPAAATTASGPWLGVVAAVYNSDGRPFTHTLPGGSPSIPASTAGYVDVYDDPDVVYVINADATAGDANIGQYVDVTAGTPTTAAGRSGRSVKMATVSAAAVGRALRIVGLAPQELGEGSAHNDIEVVISNHHFRQ